MRSFTFSAAPQQSPPMRATMARNASGHGLKPYFWDILEVEAIYIYMILSRSIYIRIYIYTYIYTYVCICTHNSITIMIFIYHIHNQIYTYTCFIFHATCYILHIYIYTHTQCIIHVYIIKLYINIQICIHVCVYIYISLQIRIHTCVYLSIFMYVCMHACMHACELHQNPLHLSSCSYRWSHYFLGISLSSVLCTSLTKMLLQYYSGLQHLTKTHVHNIIYIYLYICNIYIYIYRACNNCIELHTWESRCLKLVRSQYICKHHQRYTGSDGTHTPRRQPRHHCDAAQGEADDIHHGSDLALRWKFKASANAGAIFSDPKAAIQTGPSLEMAHILPPWMLRYYKWQFLIMWVLKLQGNSLLRHNHLTNGLQKDRAVPRANLKPKAARLDQVIQWPIQLLLKNFEVQTFHSSWSLDIPCKVLQW